MATGRSARCTAAVTTALLLSMVSASAAATSLQDGDAAAAQTACPVAEEPLQPAPGFETLYKAERDAERDCAQLTNISGETDARNGRILLLTGRGEIEGPIRNDSGNKDDWIRETTARAVRAEFVAGHVILPGESVSYAPVDARLYEIRVADARVTQTAKVAETLALQAADDAFTSGSEQDRSDLVTSITECAVASKEAWQNTSTSGLGEVFRYMEGKAECKKAYSAIDAIKDVRKAVPRGEGSWRQKMDDIARYFNEVWKRGLLDDAGKAARLLAG
ncbi:hypothetical protein ACIRD2_15895 [Streptomyces sp. NPDC093595]|uniref:hypothetical protein n=1 Tax=Streptomyces sp. NPDC093595 TaxID=3366045 RepID=UPI00380AC083